MSPAGRFLSDEQLVPTLFFTLLASFAVSVPAQNDTSMTLTYSAQDHAVYRSVDFAIR